MNLDYSTLIAARACLARQIQQGHDLPSHIGRSDFEDPDKLMRAYGLLAKLDGEILAAENQALGQWHNSRDGIR